MKITRIKIEKLFGLFDYDISLENEENLVILTGANGLGKTTILRILWDIVKQKSLLFSLRYKNLAIQLDNQMSFSLEEHTNWGYNREISEALGDSKPLFIEVNRLLTIKKQHRVISNQTVIKRGRNSLFSGARDLSEETTVTPSVKLKATSLKAKLEAVQENYNIVSKELDSSFPKRLMQTTTIFTEDEFSLRFERLQHKLHLLKTFRLWSEEQEKPVFDKENARVLSVYVTDMERKVSVFDEILAQLSLFTEIINKRRFLFKQLEIDLKEGFKCVIEIEGKEQEIPLEDLSSGEQHEIVVLYELIFNADENTLVLIDEPEVSLHVTWQRQFVKDLLKIIKLRGMQVIVATHSPQIIANRWDLVHNLTPEGEEVEDEEA